jgi:hypothetical protein
MCTPAPRRCRHEDRDNVTMKSREVLYTECIAQMWTLTWEAVLGIRRNRHEQAARCLKQTDKGRQAI